MVTAGYLILDKKTLYTVFLPGCIDIDTGFGIYVFLSFPRGRCCISHLFTSLLEVLLNKSMASFPRKRESGVVYRLVYRSRFCGNDVEEARILSSMRKEKTKRYIQ